MRNMELIEEILEILNRTKDRENFLSPAEFQIKTLIEKERPYLKSNNHYPQQDVGIDY